jgi:gliding motility-associated-like protein
MRFLAFIVICLSSSLSFAQIPSANFSLSTDQFCQGACIIVTNNSAGNPINYEWTFQGGIPAVYNGPNPGPICFNGPGVFAITLTVTNTFGTNQTAQTVSVGETPIVNATLSDTLDGAYIEINDTTIGMYQEAYLYASGTPPGGTMIWYPSGNISDSLLPQANDSLIVTPFYDTYYVAAYSTPEGCTSYDTVLVSVWFQDTLTTDSVAVGINVALPNSFSPNDDNVNDLFRVLTNVDSDQNFNNGFYEGGAIVEVDFRIFDRYGQMIFRTTDPHEGWDGTYKGKDVNTATYYYLLEYRLIDGVSKLIKGDVTLFR